MKKNSIRAAALACCFFMLGCRQAPMQSQSSEYDVLTVATTDRTIPVDYSATIRGRQDIAIYAQVSGKIAQVCINEGQRVRNGQTLFIIDQVPYKAALQTAEANVAAAKASVATAQLTAKAQFAQAEAQRVNAANNLSYTVVTSPSDGIVGTLPYKVGALVGPSTPQPLTTVSDNSEMYVYFSMTENQLLNLTREYGSIDNTLKNMPDVQLRLNDGSVYDEAGRIEAISGVIDTSTGSVQLRAAFPNPNGLLHSGGAGNIILPYIRKQCVVIPQAATFELQDKVYVYKVVDGKATSAAIAVDRISNGREYIVNSGLVPGDVIVAEGVGLMREGTPVQPKAQKAAAQPETAKEE